MNAYGLSRHWMDRVDGQFGIASECVYRGQRMALADERSWDFSARLLGNMLVGALAALASWGMQKAAVLIGGTAGTLSFSTADMANAIVIGFGGASWFKSQIEKVILQKAAVVAASKPSDSAAAGQIATSSPMEAFKAANNMKS